MSDALVGAAFRIATRVTDRNGLLADAPDLALHVERPDGTTVRGDVHRDDTGLYHAPLTLTQPGRHVVRWSSATLHFTRVEIVHAYDHWDCVGIISLDEAKDQVCIARDEERWDIELSETVRAATQVVERYIGAVIPRPRVERLVGSGSAVLTLAGWPIVAVTEVTVDGVALSRDRYHPDIMAGLLYRDDGLWTGQVEVAYEIGRPVVPDAVLAAARIIVRDMWQVRQGPLARSRVLDPAHYSVPAKARELLEGPSRAVA